MATGVGYNDRGLTTNLENIGEESMTGKLISGLVAACLVVFVGTAASGWDAEGEKNALAAIEEFKKADPSIDAFFSKAHAYAVFPEITKGAVGIGGAGGDGVVFQSGTAIGASSMSQVTIGLQLGGQTYREAIFFENETALEEFKRGNYEVAAGASAIAAKAGASKTAGYEQGVAIFTMGIGGLMFEASIGGQKFDYEPK
jgi:lipid-binding SYLF domain-containing protein